MADISALSDTELLSLRLCELDTQIQGSWFEPLLERFQNELRHAGIDWSPILYLGDEWFSPEGEAGISIPFFLAQPRLMELEKAQMYEVEGSNPEHFLKLLRHEAGHCIDHLFKLSKRSSYKKLFGKDTEDYHPETYKPHPYSKAYVQNLENWYAQAHPSEDFAETFAVWLDPSSNWQQRYKSWPLALAKLQYVERLVKELKTKKTPPIVCGFAYQARKSKMTLKKYYERKQKENATENPEFYDKDLKKLFLDPDGLTEQAPFEKAEAFLKRHNKLLRDDVARFTGAKKYTVEVLLKKIQQRCRKLNLRCPKDATQVGIRLSSYLSSLVSHYLFTGKFQRTV